MIKLALKKIKIKCKVYFLAPNSTKMWVTGDGRAKKPEVVNCVKEILGLGKNIKVASHEADAMALIFTFRLFLIGEMDEKNCRAIKGRCYDN
jgi:Holliday junction resolvasome RuvABC endonuclease subunit